MDEPIMIDRSDVEIVQLARPCSECDTRPRTHYIQLTVREVGMSTQIGGEYCQPCATKVALRIRQALPEVK